MKQAKGHSEKRHTRTKCREVFNEFRFNTEMTKGVWMERGLRPVS